MPDRQCSFVKPDGERCRGRAGPSGLCVFHDPAVEARRREGRRRGGRQAHRRVAVLPPDGPDFVLASPHDVRECLAAVANATLKGRLDPRVANATCYTLSTLLKSIEGDELARRIERLELAAERQLSNGHPKGGRL
jgi:hypothetical protein